MKRFLHKLMAILMILILLVPSTGLMEGKEKASETKLKLGVGETYDLNLTINKPKYSSSDNAVVTVSKKGVLTAKGTGTATVTVKSNKKVVGTYKVTVLNAPKKITLSAKKIVLVKGKSQKLKATLTEGSASQITWTSNKPKIAKVDKNGKVTAVSAGTAKITAKTFNGKKATCTVTVRKDANPTSVSFAESSVTLGVKEKITLNPVVDEGSIPEFTWSVKNKKVAKVSSNGVITGVKKGTTTVTVKTQNGLSATLTVKVKKAPTSVKLNKDAARIEIGDTLTLKAKLSSGSASAIKWSSSDETIATVDEKGVVTGISLGSAVITAKTYNGKKATCTVEVNIRTNRDFDMSNGVITGYHGPGGEITLPETDYEGNLIVEIGEDAFANNANIEKVTIGRSVKRISARAFLNCSRLKEIYIPDTVETIAEDAFDSTITIACGLNGYAYYFATHHDPQLKVRLEGTFEISKVEKNGNRLIVTVLTSASASLQVDFMSEDLSDVITTQTREIMGDGSSTQEIEFNLEDLYLPDYYATVVAIIDSYGNRITDPYNFLETTEAYAQFLGTQPEDFDEGTVLNYGSAGFAVMNSNVINANGSKSNNNYIVRVSSLQVGDCLYLQNINDLVKVKSFTRNADGTYTVVPDPDITLGEFYQYIRFDNSFDAMDVLGRNNRLDPKAISWSGTLAEYHKTYTHGAFTADVYLGAIVNCKFNYDVRLFARDYMEAEAAVELKGNATYTLSREFSWDTEIPVYQGDIPVGIPGLSVDVEMTVPIEFHAEGSIEFKTGFDATMGFHYETGSSLRKIQEATVTKQLTAKAGASVSAGPKVSVGLAIGVPPAGAVVIGVNGQIGVELEADTTLVDIDFTHDPDEIHACSLCFDVAVKRFINVGAAVTARLFGESEDIVSKTWPVSKTPIFEGYLSVINSADSPLHGRVTLGEGECPNHKYRTNVTTKDDQGNEVAGKTVNIKNQSTGATVSGLSPFETYLYQGNYEATSTYNGGTARQAFSIESSPKNVVLRINAKGTIYGQVSDALTGYALSGAVISAGTFSTTSDEYGYYSLELPADRYTVTVSKADYQSYSFDVTVTADEEILRNVSLSKENSGVVRVVLTWGATPSDLDSHLEFLNYHVYYWDKTSPDGTAMLDVDDTTSYGPETVTFEPQSGVTYTYYVHDYTNRYNESSYEMGNSGAKVNIYLPNGTHYERSVPRGMGIKWIVFTYKDGVIRFGRDAVMREVDDTLKNLPEKK